VRIVRIVRASQAGGRRYAGRGCSGIQRGVNSIDGISGILETQWLAERIDYSGRELRSHFIRECAGIRGDGLIAFTGGCNVSEDRLVDLDDAESDHFIEARLMLHFIGEHFQCPLSEGNIRLRLFASIVAETVEVLAPRISVRRYGDDLFVEERKLSVAICTVSPVSTVFHLGVNVDPYGAPVPAVGLEELGVEPRELAGRAMETYGRECESLGRAIRKVKGVP
jgi:hypothetical protein